MAAQKLSQEAFKLTYRIGKVLPSVKSNAARIKIPIFELDTNLNMVNKISFLLKKAGQSYICRLGTKSFLIFFSILEIGIKFLHMILKKYANLEI